MKILGKKIFGYLSKKIWFRVCLVTAEMFEHRNSGENRRKRSTIFFENVRRAYKDLIKVKKKSKLSHACVPLRSPGIDSQPGGPLRQPFLPYRTARLHRLAESIPERFSSLRPLREFTQKLAHPEENHLGRNGPQTVTQCRNSFSKSFLRRRDFLIVCFEYYFLFSRA